MQCVSAECASITFFKKSERKCYGLIHLLFITVVKYLDSRSIEEVQDILKQLQDDQKKRKEKKKQKQQQWLQIRKEVSNLIKDINFEEEMEEDESNESMEIESSEQEEMEISQEEMKNVTPIVKFSTLLLMMYLKQKETSQIPIIQPFSSDEEKTLVQVSYLLKYSNHK